MAPMNLTLNWDLFIIVFFAIVITYTFIIGKKESVKIICATYMAIVAVQGLSAIIERMTGKTEPIFQFLGFSMDMSLLSVIKIGMFITIVIALAVKAGLDVRYNDEGNMVMNGVMTGLFGFATAGLLLSTILTYIAGTSLLEMSFMASNSSNALSTLIAQSQMMQILIANQALWFSFPALLLIVAGFMARNEID